MLETGGVGDEDIADKVTDLNEERGVTAWDTD